MTTEHNVIEMHHTFGHPARDRPQTLSREEALMVLKLIEEEFLELVAGMFPGHYVLDEPTVASIIENSTPGPDEWYKPNLTEIADAVGDLDVVVNGAGVRHGFDMRLLNEAIHKSNMSKLGDDGQPIYYTEGPKKGKFAKGPNFVEPDLSAVIA